MKKFLLIFCVLVALFAVIASGIIYYINKVVLPVKIKSLIISYLEGATQKKTSLQSVEFNIFKGLVLKDPSLSDGAKTLISIKEGSCTFLVLALFKRSIVIPNVKLNSAVIFLERRPDHTFNFADLIPAKTIPESKTKFTPLFLKSKDITKGRARFNIFIYKISLKNSRIDFQDHTLSPIFTKSMDNLNLVLNLSLPTSIT